MNADADRAAHNPKVAGSNPAPATIELQVRAGPRGPALLLFGRSSTGSSTGLQRSPHECAATGVRRDRAHGVRPRRRAGVDEHQPDDLVGVRRRERHRIGPAEGVADDDVGTGLAGHVEQLVQVGDLAVERLVVAGASLVPVPNRS